MEDWKPYKLKEITTKIGSGSTPTGGKNAYYKNGIALVRSLNVYDFVFEYKDLAFINETQAKKLNGVKLEKGDILLNITGASVGRCTIIPENVLPARVNQHVSIIRCDKNKVDSAFLSYCINSSSYKDALMSIADSGATREALTKEDIEKFQILLPPLPIQQQIASIQSAYDDLVEVNNQLIKLLEETASQLYKEWFVRMRFPGYQNTKFETGIPEGWEVKKISDIAFINKNNISSKSKINKIEYIDISSVTTGRIESTTKYFLKEAPGRAKRIVKHGDTLFSTVRPENKAYSFIVEPDENTIASTGFCVLTPKQEIYNEFIYFVIASEMFIDEMTIKAKGSAYPQVSFNDVGNYKILLPVEKYIASFHKIVEPMFKQAKIAQQQNIQLRQIRDRLLPRLISGKLQVKEATKISEHTSEEVLETIDK